MRDHNQKNPNPKPTDPPRVKDDDCGCKENNTLTQKTINKLRKTYCNELDAAAGAVYQWEENYLGWKELRKSKKCLFIWTEKNYQAFRNLQLTKGGALNQFNEAFKANTSTFLKANKALADGLKDIVKKVKEVQGKIAELHKAACDLKHCAHEACNCTQWGILTGEWPDDCKGTRPEIERPSLCDGVKDKLEKLFKIPCSLDKDAELTLQASADVAGIQVFANVGTLEGLQKTLSESAIKFDKYLQDTVKKDQEDLKKMQEDFGKAVLEYVKSKTTVFTKRSEFVGLLETTGYFCCPDCGCVQDDEEKCHKCEPRLKDCKEKICDICTDVKDTFCKEPAPAS
jgi:gas vesicle protein